MSNVAGAAQAIQGVDSIAGGILQSDATRASGNYTNEQFKVRAELDDLASKQAGIEGANQESALAERTSQQAGQARASFASQGVLVTSGSARAAEDRISRVSGINELAIRHRVWQEQLGYRMAATGDRAQGLMALAAGNNTANAQLTGGIMAGLSYGVKAADSFYEGSKAPPPKKKVDDRPMNEPDGEKNGAVPGYE